MKAILMTRPGSPDVLELADIPEPALSDPGQIKVRLRAAGVNPIDTKLRKRGVFFPDALPAVLGCDGAGEVVETGADVTRFKVGDRVWFCHGGLGAEQGNYAEFTVLDQRWAAPLPDSLSFELGAAAPLVLITAWGGLYDRARLTAGQTVLIHAGTGGVGHVAIQLAKLRGARVIATVSSPEKAAMARQWGADETVDYRSCDFAEAVNELTSGQGADVVLDTVGPDVFMQSLACTAHFGDIVTLLDLPEQPLKEARLRNLRIGFELMLTPQLRGLEKARLHQVHMLETCGAWMAEGKLQINVSHTLPLEQAAHAHDLLETGHMSGKTVLTLG
ncbi:zinc-dependent alcohol dehydrogenase family protein [Methyloterricola oryzae]|uniref:zinc-dependent alcohol dehydrogenase family protein n=1 Tax=Methyloterricola oryzae TaxID=1495050 RepID=UPI0005EBEC06|nr:zinc-dependent alcohol dehydrogenase family protein [Methyloterricola oryzae]